MSTDRTSHAANDGNAGRAPRVARKRALALGLTALIAFAALPALNNTLWAGAEIAPAPVAGAPGQMPGSLADIVERVSPAVVTVEVVQGAGAAAALERGGPFDFRIPGVPPGSPFEEYFKRFFGEPGPMGREHGTPRPRREARSVGSGFLIGAEGYVVTNNHVVEGGSEITVIVKGGERLEAKLVGRDPKTDLALLKVEGEAPFAHVTFGDSGSVRVGDWVVAVGNPFGLGGTVTAGIVSARGRDIGMGPYDDFIQIDAPINQGNSGGPTFNLNGEVIGVNTAIFSPSGGSVGIGFAVPAAVAKEVIASLKDNGRVERGWLGVQIQGVSEEMAESVGLEEAEGAIVVAVTDSSPAAKAGIEQGDVILAVDGRAVGTVRDLSRMIARLGAGKTAELSVWRDGRRLALSAEIGRLPESDRMAAARPAEGSGEVLGMKLAKLDADARRALGIEESVEGAVIAEVDPRSEAAERGLQRGDVIVAVNRKPVSGPADIVASVASAKAERRKAVLMMVARGGARRFVALRLGDA